MGGDDDHLKRPSWIMLISKTARSLHGSDATGVVLPLVLLAVGAALVLYAHVYAARDDLEIRNFLSMVLLTMVPVAFLEMRLFKCSDPVGLLFRFSPKVLMMHVSFMVLRLYALIEVRYAQRFFSSTAVVLFALGGVIAGFLLLPIFFDVQPWNVAKLLREHWDVCIVGGLALGGAIVTEGLNVAFHTASTMIMDVVDTTALYLELMAFVPALWMVCRDMAFSAPSRPAVAIADARRRAVPFFAFLATFYVSEDIVAAVVQCFICPLASLGHLAHFLLLVDFAAFFLHHLYDQGSLEKIWGKVVDLFRDGWALV
mmetsp:Transcript_58802/g.108587  ORF Transcript_58802/g.108587 Transcript_58802/m.108587 type:complete len:314 (-) Transcript_58802:259-1200(-)